MKYLKTDAMLMDMDSGEDVQTATGLLTSRAEELRQQLVVRPAGQGLWLAVTFPMDAELSVAMLQHVVDETPSDSDGAAVAATAAHYIVELRAPEGKERENLLFYTNHMLATVARRHSAVHDQEAFARWVKT